MTETKKGPGEIGLSAPKAEKLQQAENSLKQPGALVDTHRSILEEDKQEDYRKQSLRIVAKKQDLVELTQDGKLDGELDEAKLKEIAQQTNSSLEQTRNWYEAERQIVKTVLDGEVLASQPVTNKEKEVAAYFLAEQAKPQGKEEDKKTYEQAAGQREQIRIDQLKLVADNWEDVVRQRAQQLADVREGKVKPEDLKNAQESLNAWLEKKGQETKPPKKKETELQGLSEEERKNYYEANKEQIDKDLEEITEAVNSLTQELQAKGIGEEAVAKIVDITRVFNITPQAIDDVLEAGLPDLTSSQAIKEGKQVTSEEGIKANTKLALELAREQAKLFDYAKNLPQEVLEEKFPGLFEKLYPDGLPEKEETGKPKKKKEEKKEKPKKEAGEPGKEKEGEGEEDEEEKEDKKGKKKKVEKKGKKKKEETEQEEHDHWENTGNTVSVKDYLERQGVQEQVAAAKKLMEVLEQIPKVKALIEQAKKEAEKQGRSLPSSSADKLHLLKLAEDRIARSSYYDAKKPDDPLKKAFAEFRSENPEARFGNGEWLMALDYLNHEVRSQHNSQTMAEFWKKTGKKPERRMVQPEVGRLGQQLYREGAPVSILQAEKSLMAEGFLKDYQVFQVVKDRLMPKNLRERIAALQAGELEGEGSKKEQVKKAVQESYDFDRKLLLALSFADPDSLKNTLTQEGHSSEEQKTLFAEVTTLRKLFDSLHDRFLRDGFERVALEYEGLTPADQKAGRAAIKRRLENRLKGVDPGEVRERCFKALQNRLWREMYIPVSELVDEPSDKIHEKKLVQVVERKKERKEPEAELEKEISITRKADAPGRRADAPGRRKTEMPSTIKFGLVAGKGRIAGERGGKEHTGREALEYEGMQFASLAQTEQRKKWEMKGKGLRHRLKVMAERSWNTAFRGPTRSKEKLHAMKMFAAAGIEGKLPYELYELVDKEARKRLESQRQSMSRGQKIRAKFRDVRRELTFRERDLHEERVKVMRNLRQNFENDPDGVSIAGFTSEQLQLQQLYKDVVLGNWQEKDALASRLADTSLEEVCHVAMGEKRTQEAVLLAKDSPVGDFINKKVLQPLIASAERNNGRVDLGDEAKVRKEMDDYFLSSEFRQWRDGLSDEQQQALDESLLYATNIIDVCKTELIPVSAAALEHGKALEDISFDIELTLGTGKWGPRGKVEQTWVEERFNTNKKLWEKLRVLNLQNQTVVNEQVLQEATAKERAIGVFGEALRSEFLVGALTGAAVYGTSTILRKAGQLTTKTPLGVVGYTFAPLLAGSAAAGAVAGLKERARLNAELGQHNIEKALNYQFPEDASRRVEMQQFTMEMVSFTDRIEDLESLTSQDLDAESALKLLGLVADTEARIAVSDRKAEDLDANLFTSDSPLTYSVDSKNLDIARAKAKQKFRQTLLADEGLRSEVISRLAENEADLESLASGASPEESVVNGLMVRLTEVMEQNIENSVDVDPNLQAALGEVSLIQAEGMKAKQKAFKKHRAVKSVKAGAVIFASSVVMGSFISEGVARLAGRPGALEVGWRALTRDNTWFESMYGAAPGFMNSVVEIAKDTDGDMGMLRLSKNLEIRGGNLVDTSNNKVVVENFTANADFQASGQLDSQTLDSLHQAGLETEVVEYNLTTDPAKVHKIAGFKLPPELKVGDIDNDGKLDLFYDFGQHGQIELETPPGFDPTDKVQVQQVLEDHGFEFKPGKTEILAHPIDAAHSGREQVLDVVKDVKGVSYEIKMAVPEGTHLQTNPDGSYNLVLDHNQSSIAHFDIGSDGSPQLIDAEHGVILTQEPAGTIVVGETEQVVGTKVPTIEEFVKDHPEIETWKRGPYYNQDTIGKYDYNELKTFWGGNKGFNADGDIIINTKRMTENGSWVTIGGVKDSVDVPQMIKDGRMFVGLELFDDYRKYIIRVPIDPETGRAVIENGSFAHQLFGKTAKGRAFYKGPAFGIFFDHENGTQGIVSSVLGKGSFEIPPEEITKTVTETQALFRPKINIPRIEITTPGEITPPKVLINEIALPKEVMPAMPFPIPYRRPLEAPEGEKTVPSAEYPEYGEYPEYPEYGEYPEYPEYYEQYPEYVSYLEYPEYPEYPKHGEYPEYPEYGEYPEHEQVSYIPLYEEVYDELGLTEEEKEEFRGLSKEERMKKLAEKAGIDIDEKDSLKNQLDQLAKELDLNVKTSPLPLKRKHPKIKFLTPVKMTIVPPQVEPGISQPTLRLTQADKVDVSWKGKVQDFVVPLQFKRWFEEEKTSPHPVQVIDAFGLVPQEKENTVLIAGREVDKAHLEKALKGKLGDFNRWDTIEEAEEVPGASFRVVNIPLQTKDNRTIILRLDNSRYDLLQQTILTPEQKKDAAKGRLQIQGSPKIETTANGTEYAETAAAFAGKRYKIEAASNVGDVRALDEDFTFSFQGQISALKPEDQVVWSLHGVADGMGGHASGNIASKEGMGKVFEIMNGLKRRADGNFEYKGRDIGSTVEEVMDYIRLQALDEIERKAPGGGTTLAAVLFWEDKAYALNVGDSRVYKRKADGSLEQITKDNSLVQRMLDLGQITPAEAAVHPYGNVILKKFGDEFDIKEFVLEDDEGLFICCDGVPEPYGEEYLEKDETPEKMEAVINRAVDEGKNPAVVLIEQRPEQGKDNMSVLILTPEKAEEETIRKMEEVIDTRYAVFSKKTRRELKERAKDFYSQKTVKENKFSLPVLDRVLKGCIDEGFLIEDVKDDSSDIGEIKKYSVGSEGIEEVIRRLTPNNLQIAGQNLTKNQVINAVCQFVKHDGGLKSKLLKGSDKEVENKLHAAITAYLAVFDLLDVPLQI